MARPPGRAGSRGHRHRSATFKAMAGNPYLGTRVSLLGARSHPRHGLLGTGAGLCFCSELKLVTGMGNHAVCLSLSHLFVLSPVFLPKAGPSILSDPLHCGPSRLGPGALGRPTQSRGSRHNPAQPGPPKGPGGSETCWCDVSEPSTFWSKMRAAWRNKVGKHHRRCEPLPGGTSTRRRI